MWGLTSEFWAENEGILEDLFSGLIFEVDRELRPTVCRSGWNRSPEGFDDGSGSVYAQLQAQL
jgi:hypothetical protein